MKAGMTSRNIEATFRINSGKYRIDIKLKSHYDPSQKQRSFLLLRSVFFYIGKEFLAFTRSPVFLIPFFLLRTITLSDLNLAESPAIPFYIAPHLWKLVIESLIYCPVLEVSMVMLK